MGILEISFLLIKQAGPKVVLHLNRQLRRAAPSRWGGGLGNARVANGNLVPWHHSAGDNLRSTYASTISKTKMLVSLKHIA